MLFYELHQAWLLDDLIQLGQHYGSLLGLHRCRLRPHDVLELLDRQRVDGLQEASGLTGLNCLLTLHLVARPVSPLTLLGAVDLLTAPTAKVPADVGAPAIG